MQSVITAGVAIKEGDGSAALVSPLVANDEPGEAGAERLVLLITLLVGGRDANEVALLAVGLVNSVDTPVGRALEDAADAAVGYPI